MLFKPVQISLTLYIPAKLERLGVWAVLLYHRLRHGYQARLIPVGQGKYAIVDIDDYERLAKYKWHLCDNGCSSYAFRWSGGTRKRVWMHREVVDIPEGLVCDHINHNSLDNRKANVRPATVSQNTCNARKRTKTSSPYRGVNRDARSNRCRARIELNGRQIHLGTFDDQEQAAKAYDAAAKKYHGRFALLNFPDRQPNRLRLLAGWFLAKIAEKWGKICKSVQKWIKTAKEWAESGWMMEAEVRRSDYQGIRGQGIRTSGDQESGFFEKIGENSAKVSERCEKLIEIVRKCAIMNTVQMARGP
jgi:hypothetical protein